MGWDERKLYWAAKGNGRLTATDRLGGTVLRLTKEDVFGWDNWLVWRLSGVPLIAGSIVTLCLMSSFICVMLGFYAYGVDGELVSLGAIASKFGDNAYSWAVLLSSLLGGYSIAVMAFAVVTEKAELPALAEMLGREKQDMIDIHNEANQHFQKKVSVYGWIGYGIGVVCIVFTLPGLGAFLGLGELPHGRPLFPFEIAAEVWFLILVPFLYYVMGKGMYFTIRKARFLNHLQDLYLKIDIWHPEKVRVITRLAMGRALFWLIGSTIGSLFFLDDSINLTALSLVFGAIGFIASLLFVLPVYRLHVAFKVVKEEELVRVRDVIKRNWNKLQGTPTDEAMIARVGGLVALEQRIESVSEWPLDLSTIGRFGLYLAIPMVSWIGGALVEQLVDGVIN